MARTKNSTIIAQVVDNFDTERRYTPGDDDIRVALFHASKSTLLLMDVPLKDIKKVKEALALLGVMHADNAARKH